MNIEFVLKDGQVKMGIVIPPYVCREDRDLRVEFVNSLPLFTAAKLRELADELDARNARATA